MLGEQRNGMGRAEEMAWATVSTYVEHTEIQTKVGWVTVVV